MFVLYCLLAVLWEGARARGVVDFVKFWILLDFEMRTLQLGSSVEDERRAYPPVLTHNLLSLARYIGRGSPKTTTSKT